MFFLALSAAYADETTGPETCVIERYDSAHCEVCSDASYDDPTACSARLDATRDLACRTQGASVWSEIWCDPEHVDVVSKETKDCAAVGGVTGGIGVLVGLIGVLVGRRRA